MLIVTLQGGLGNQLFQIANAVKRSAGLVIVDTTLMDVEFRDSAVASRSFESGLLVSVLGWRQLRLPRFVPGRAYRRLVNAVAVRGGTGGRFVARVWQTASHINGSAGSESPQLVGAMRRAGVKRAEGFRTMQGVHVRLGDYTKLAHIYGTPDVDYYRRAVESYFDADSEVIVFSDEPLLAITLLQDAMPSYFFRAAEDITDRSVDRHTSAWRNLIAMASCRSLVAGNSTYSWWAIWIGVNVFESKSLFVGPAQMIPTGLAPPNGALSIEWKR